MSFDSDKTNPYAWIKYSGYSTTNFEVDGKPFYCAQSPKNTPQPGFVDLDTSSYAFEERYGSTEALLIKKVLYYAPGGPGYETHKDLWERRFEFSKNEDHPSMLVEGNRARVYAHEIISYAITGTFGRGVTAVDRESFKRYVVDPNYPGTIASRIMALDPDLSNCTFGLVKGKTSSTQDILGIVHYERPSKQGVISIHKSLKLTAGESGKTELNLEGICFVISDEYGREISRIYTDKRGHANSFKLDFGSYHIQERLDDELKLKLAEQGIVIDESSLVDEYVTLSEQHANRITEILYELPLSYINREKTVQLKLIKKDSASNQVILQDCSYALYNDKKELMEWVDEQGVAHTEFHSSQGKISFPHRLKAGRYYIKEVQAPRGYMLDEKMYPVDIDLADSTKLTLEKEYVQEVFDDALKGSIEIYKYDSDTKQTLAGTEFVLIAAEDILSPQGSLLFQAGQELMRVLSNEEGIARMNQLALGRYIVRETQAPSGYIRDGRDYEIELKAGNTHEDIVQAKITIENAKNRLIVKKVDKLSHQSLKDSHFQLKAFKLPEDFELASLKTEAYRFNSNKDKAGLPAETEAIIASATSAPNGLTASLKKGLPSTADPESTKAIELGGFNGFINTLMKTPADDETRELITDDSGYSYASKLKPGYLYVLSESQAPKGYEIDEAARNYYTVDEQGKLIEIMEDSSHTEARNTIETERGNYPLTQLEISKKSITGSEELPGAKLELYRGEELVESWISGDVPHLIKGLPVGKYRLKETIAPDGYLLAHDVEFDLLQEDGIQHVEMRDDYTKLHINKRDLASQHMIAGAKLELIHKESGKLVESWTSDYHTKEFNKLEAGVYLIRELEAPEGYQKAPELEFKLEAIADVQEIDFFNQKEPPPAPKHELPPAYLPKTGAQSRAVYFIVLSLAGLALAEYGAKKLSTKK